MKLYQDAVNKGIRAAWLYSRLGQMYLRQGNREEAIPNFESAAQMNPYDYDSLQNLAVAYRETGRVADAEAVLQTDPAIGRGIRAGLQRDGHGLLPEGRPAGGAGILREGRASWTRPIT